MPALVLFGQRTAVAGDELSTGACCCGAVDLIHLAISLSAIPLLLQYHHGDDNDSKGIPTDATEDCEENLDDEGRLNWVLLATYCVLSVVLDALSILTDGLFFRTTRQGTPLETEVRNPKLRGLCVWNLIPLSLLRATTFGTGLSSLFHLERYCKQSSMTTGGIPCYNSNEQDEICPQYHQRRSLLATLVGIDCFRLTVILVLYVYFIFPQMGRSWKCLQMAFSPYTQAAWRLQSTTNDQSKDEDSISALATQQEKKRNGWQLFCRFCCTCTSLLTCCLYGGLQASSADFLDVSTALTVLFDWDGYVDVTLSDLLAGLAMVAKEQSLARATCLRRIRLIQRQEQVEIEDNRNANSPDTAKMVDQTATTQTTEACAARKIVTRPVLIRRPPTSTTSPDEPPTPSSMYQEGTRYLLNQNLEEDRQVIQDGVHFMRLAYGIYGFTMYMERYGFTSVCRLATGYFARRSTTSKTAPKTTTRGDFTRIHRVCFQSQTGIPPEDLVYASFLSGVNQRPYCIVIDRKEKAVVLVVRGTLSLEDAVNDLTLKPTSLEEWGTRYGYDGRGEYAHAGFYASTEWLLHDLEEQGTLQRLLHPGQPGPENKGVNDPYSCRDYRLVVVGHSLGAGVAALLALNLRQNYPSLQCLCFSPPGCTVSPRLAKQEFITTYIRDFDIVPRMGISQFVNLRDDMITMIARIKVPKHQIFAIRPSVVCQGEPVSVGEQNDDVGLNCSMFCARNNIPDCEFVRQIAKFERRTRERELEEGFAGKLTIPGKRIVHILTTSSGSVLQKKKRCLARCFCGEVDQPDGDEYTAIYADLDDFAEVAVVRTFFNDHNPRLVLLALQGLARSFGLPVDG